MAAPRQNACVTYSRQPLTLGMNVLLLCHIHIRHGVHLVTMHYTAWSQDGRSSSRQLPVSAAPAHTTDSHCMQLRHTSMENVAACWLTMQYSLLTAISFMYRIHWTMREWVFSKLTRVWFKGQESYITRKNLMCFHEYINVQRSWRMIPNLLKHAHWINKRECALFKLDNSTEFDDKTGKAVRWASRDP